MSNKAIHILFGTESGNSEKMAIIAKSLAEKMGLDAHLVDMAKFEPEDLKDWQALIMVISTNGDGEMPINAETAWEEAQKLKLTGLDHLQYGILGLGDTGYDYFCQAGIDWDEYLQTAGAKSMTERGDIDIDFYEPSLEWIKEAFASYTETSMDDVAKSLNEALASDESLSGDAGSESYSHSNPWHAEILEKRDLCSEGSSKSVRHYSLKLEGSNIDYKPGDCIEVLPKNEPALVQKLIEVVGLTSDQKVTINGKPYPLSEALEHHLEIRQPTLKLLKLLASRTASSALIEVIDKNDKAAIEELLYGHDVASLIEKYAKPQLPKTDIKSKLLSLIGKKQFYPRFEASVLLNYLKPLQARAYSIASSQNSHPGEVHLTIADVNYQKDNQEHAGVCSNYLAKHLQSGSKVKCWLLPNKYFALPEDKEKNIIMVGPGTGIAPFIGFLQEREQQQATGANWLFFGDRESKHDFLYQPELDAFKEKGTLTRLDTAFSRDQEEKIYVQNKIKEAAKDLFEWLEKGAIFYICGDAKQMALDVEEALLNIIHEQGQLSLEGAQSYLKAMQKEQRYLKDVY